MIWLVVTAEILLLLGLNSFLKAWQTIRQAELQVVRPEAQESTEP